MGAFASRDRTKSSSTSSSSPAHGAHGAHAAAPAAGETGAAGEAEAARWRAEADRQAQLRNDCFERSKKAYAAGDGALAKQLSLEGKEHDRLLKEANQRASDAVFAAKNAVVKEDEIDLHGLQVKEAIERTEARLDACMREGRDHLVIIVGRGNHSVNNIPKIKPAVQSMLRKYEAQLTAELDTPNPGCVTVRFKPGAAPPAAGTKGSKKRRESAPTCVLL
jgi:DNA-nicking Smr family endonuclease